MNPIDLQRVKVKFTERLGLVMLASKDGNLNLRVEPNHVSLKIDFLGREITAPS